VYKYYKYCLQIAEVITGMEVCFVRRSWSTQKEKVSLKMQFRSRKNSICRFRKVFVTAENRIPELFFLVVVSRSFCLFTFPFVLPFCHCIFTGTSTLCSYQRNAADSKISLKFLKQQSSHRGGIEFLELVF